MSNTINAVTDSATAADKLWMELHGAPGGTSAELAEQAGIGGSTARKLLAALECNGAAIRTAGESDGSARRPADRWWPEIAPADSDTTGGADAVGEPATAADTAQEAEDAPGTYPGRG
ncbi:hypothetical protein ACLMAL_23800 [Nocardia sp. CWNU-33]|uniref:hypothetical protein n=1 Tax=Nocardia sp. CWNU-33 TaxID=3392117 RepID=UPI00398EBB01